LRIAELRLKGMENLTAKEKEELNVLEGIKTQAQVIAEITDLTAKLVAGTILPAERERLAVLIGQTAEITKQAAKVKEQEESIYRIIELGKTDSSANAKLTARALSEK